MFYRAVNDRQECYNDKNVQILVQCDLLLGITIGFTWLWHLFWYNIQPKLGHKEFSLKKLSNSSSYF